MQKKVVTMQEEKSQFILPPVTPVGKNKTGLSLDNSDKPFSTLPEMSGIAQLTNTSISGFNIDDISVDNFLQDDQDSIKFDTGKSKVSNESVINPKYFRCREFESNTRGQSISSKCNGG